MCKYLKDMQKRILAGEDPDLVIPWEVPRNITPDEYKEFLYFAAQVLPEGPRRSSVLKKLEGMNESRTEGE